MLARIAGALGIGGQAPASAPAPRPPVAQTYQALLTAGAQTVLDGSGNGIAVCGPSGLGSAWVPAQVAVGTATSVSTPVAYLYLGPLLPVTALKALLATSQVSQLGGTSNGANDSIGLLGIQVPQGQALIVQWLGGDAGTTATMTVTGQQTATYWR